MPRLPSSHRRILVSLGGLAGIAVVLVGGVYLATESGRTAVQADAHRLALVRENAASFANSVHDQENALADLLLTGELDSAQWFAEAITKADASAAAIDGIDEGLPGVPEGLEDVRASVANWRATFAQPAFDLARSGGDTSGYAPLLGDLHESLDSALGAFDGTLSSAEATIVSREAQIGSARDIGILVALVVAGLTSLAAMFLIRRYGTTLERDASHAGVLNRFTEVTSFATDDTSVAASNLEALSLLVRPDASVTHVLNRSQDRAVPEAKTGDAIADVLQLKDASHCAGVLRGSMYVVPDLAAPLTVRCPVYPESVGTLACIPLNSGEWVGTVHLYWKQRDAFPLELRSGVHRIAEHAALAISNRRLLGMLQGQANTDPRTGLANSRAFDDAVKSALTSLRADDSLAVMMLDVDHFKQFNDRYGHPAGDDALRALARVLESCMREGDLAARYGGEEFAVLVHGVGQEAAMAIAERIRVRTEATIMDLGPGTTARLNVSIGVAVAPAQASERLTLLRLADQALYRAKQTGRNRVIGAWAMEDPTPSPAARPVVASGRNTRNGRNGRTAHAHHEDTEAAIAS